MKLIETIIPPEQLESLYHDAVSEIVRCEERGIDYYAEDLESVAGRLQIEGGNEAFKVLSMYMHGYQVHLSNYYNERVLELLSEV